MNHCKGCDKPSDDINRRGFCFPCRKLRDRAAYEKQRAAHLGRIRTLVNGAKSRSKRYGYDFDLNAEMLLERVKPMKCEVTGLPMSWGLGTMHAWSPSLDRIVTGGSYTMDNIQIVCWIYNRSKSNSPDSDVMLMARALVELDDA